MNKNALKKGQRLVAATRVLHDVIFNDVHLDSAIASHCILQIRPFVQQLAYGVCRKYYYIESVLNLLMSKPLNKKDIDIKLIVIAGIYQLSCMNLPEHAVVDDAVESLAHINKTWAKKLVNAVLRNYLRRRTSIEEALKETLDSQCRYGHPRWLQQAIERAWPAQAEMIFFANNSQGPLTLRVNVSRISRNDYCALLRENGIGYREGLLSPACVILDTGLPVSRLPGFSEGLVSVQDQASQLAAAFLALKPGVRMLDACAAPGGKSSHILESCPDIQFTAIENDTTRMDLLNATLGRLNLETRGNINLHTTDFLSYDPEMGKETRLFDRILLDAPCSATGIIRRHPDIRFHRREEDVAGFALQQLAMLEHAFTLLEPGGILLYATCSILPEENQQVIAAFLDKTPSAEVQWGSALADVGAHTGMEQCHWCQKSPEGITLLPGMTEMDGFFYSRLVKHPEEVDRQAGNDR